MPIIVPIKNDPNHQLAITLDNVVFNLRFLYNETKDSWVMDIKDGNNTPIITGLRLVPNFPIIKQYVSPNLPKGDFVCNGNFDIAEITRKSFSSKEFQLLYLTEAEIGAI